MDKNLRRYVINNIVMRNTIEINNNRFICNNLKRRN